MFKNILKKISLGILYVVGAIYVLFLVLPILINPFLSKYSDEISKLAEESCGLKIKIEKLKIVTTPKLTAGVKIGHISAALPTGEEFLSADNTQAKLSLIPILAKKIEVDMFSVDNIDATLKVKPDGDLQIIDFLPEVQVDDDKEQLTELPLGLKLSNRLPNISIKEYMLTMVDMRDNREYTLMGGNLKVSDFVLDKKVKFSTAGIVKLDGAQQFSYNIKLDNRIMPDIDLNDLIFAQNSTQEPDKEKKTPEQPIAFNIIDIFKGIKANGLTADTVLDIKTSGKLDDINLSGLIDVENISLLVKGTPLPKGHLKFNFKGKKTLADIVLYTSKDQITTVSGYLTHGKHAKVDLNFKSNAGINNIFDVLKSVASSFNYNDLNTLTATGAIDADFNIKSDMKKVTSNGFFKIPDALISYALYNVLIDKINADVNFNDNNIDIKNIGLTILSHPLKIYGTISNDAVADVHITADKLLLKGLLAAAGQVNLLKENNIKSGTLSVNTTIKGKLNEIQPIVNISLDNLNLTNIPSATTIKLSSADVKLSTDKKSYKGDLSANAISINNPAANVSVPQVKVLLDEKDVNINDTYLLLGKSKIDIAGKIANYTKKNMDINIKAKGAIFASDIANFIPAQMRSMFAAKGAIPILTLIKGNDKKQTIEIQALSTPAGYLHIADLQSIAGKSMLLNSQIRIAGNSLSFDKTGAFVTTKTSLSDSPESNLGGTQIAKVTGGVSDLSNLTLKNINIATLSPQTISIPTMDGSKAVVDANITLNGNALNPNLKGYIKCPSVTVPTMKTTLKDIIVDLGSTINASLPSIFVADSKMNAKAIISPNFTNGIIVKNLDFNADFINADTLAAAVSGNTGTGAVSNSPQPSDIGVIIQSGKAKITKFQTGKIIGTNITSDFNLKNNVLSLKNLSGTAFDGKFNGNILVNVIKGNTNVDFSGSGMTAVKAIEACAGIPNALSGTLGFNAKLVLNAFAPNFNAMIKSINGTASFDVKNGTYLNIGTIDSLVLANNVLSNAILKTAAMKIKSLPVVKSSSNFASITGSVKLNNGIAQLAPVKSAGEAISYYVTGQYNLINGYTNVNILGRMSAELVVALGPLGDLSVSKISAYLPTFGANTLKLLGALTTNPATENTSQIPALTGKSSSHKDFKIVFNGNVTSPGSIKSFKWLSTCDTSQVTTGSVTTQLKNEVQNTKQNIQNEVQAAKQRAEAAKANAQAAAEDIKSQINNTKNKVNDLKNMFKKPAQQDATTESGT